LSISKSGHIYYIETLRAIAALMVIIYHFTNFQNEGNYIVENVNIRSLTSFFAQGVEMFYIISGFVIFYSLSKNAYRITNFGTYILKRIIRIIPLYWATIFSIGIINYILSNWIWSSPYEFDFTEILGNMFFVVDSFPDLHWMNPIFITLKVEFQFYILIGVLFTLLSKNKIIQIGLFAILLILGLLSQKYQTVFYNAPYFITGILLYQLQKEDSNKFINYFFLIVTGTILGLFYASNDLIIWILTVVLINWVQFTTKATEKIGYFSYAIYLTHGISGGWVLYFLTHEKIQLFPVYIAIIIAIITSLIIAYLYFLAIEKPSLKLSKKIKYP